MARAFNLIERVHAWERRLIAAFATAPVAEVVALVDEEGVQGSRDVEGYWNIDFRCEAWRINGSKIQNRPICLSRRVSPRDFVWYRRHAWPGTVVRVHARVVQKQRLGIAQGQIESYQASNVSDAELKSFRVEPIDPKHFDDPVFGMFEPAAGLPGYRTGVNWLGLPARVYLDAKKKATLSRVLASAHEIWNHRRAWRNRISAEVLREMLPLKNDHWLANGEAAVTADEFLKRMAIDLIVVEPRGKFEFWHHDGALFLNHAIVVRGSLKKGITSVDLEG